MLFVVKTKMRVVLYLVYQDAQTLLSKAVLNLGKSTVYLVEKFNKSLFKLSNVLMEILHQRILTL